MAASMKKMKSSMKKSAMKSGMKKVNDYFKAMLAAKAKDAPSFTYNGSTYVRTKNTKKPQLGYFYKKK